MAIVKANTRLPVETEGDIYSLINCNEIGCRRLGEMMDGVRARRSRGALRPILESSRAAVLAEIARLPKGSWRYEMTIDGYDEPITLAATTTIAEDAIHVDFAGTLARRALRHQQPARLHHRLFGLRPRLRRRAAGAEQRRLALRLRRDARRPIPSSTRCRRRRWPCATSSARCCRTSSSAACARRSPTASRPKAPPASNS